MTLIRHTDPRAFVAAAAPMIARSETTAHLVATAIERWLAEPPPANERLYLATFSAQSTHGIAIQRRDNAVRIEDSDIDAAMAFSNDLAGDWPQLQGVVGTLAPCEAFARAWRESTGRSAALRFRLRSHVLTHVHDVARPPGAMRTAIVDDLEWLAAAQSMFLHEARLPDDPARVRAMLPGRLERGEYRVWDDGGAVAFAGWSPAGAGSARIGPVWTDAQARQRGYATALVAALAQELLASGRCRIFLDTDLANPTSNAIYARIGFCPLRDFCHFDFVAP